jgi:hypothetical protein
LAGELWHAFEIDIHPNHIEHGEFGIGRTIPTVPSSLFIAITFVSRPHGFVGPR